MHVFQNQSGMTHICYILVSAAQKDKKMFFKTFFKMQVQIHSASHAHVVT